ncbi:hypothetical protein DPEC_G00221760 [Dallia pectoralis]|uniref:Uncharacterized protein n=1 Tax=Dallia pectoralis TaxID=75939 RepID=A0ACC2G3K8_DALPE|nr:hypothetical protein DPEC_G00221760 [Dallia pectoralis]
MSLTDGRKDKSTTAEVSLSGEHDTTAKSPIQLERPASPVPSCVSMKSDCSMNPPIAFRDGVSRDHKKRPASPVPSCVSMKSDWSMVQPKRFREGDFSTDQRDQQERSEVSEILSGPSAQSHQTDLAITKEGALKIKPHVQRNMNQKELADTLEKSELSLICQHEHKSYLKKKCQSLFEGNAKQGNPTLLNKIYTELYITEGGSGEVNNEHEVRQIETTSRKQARPETAIKCNDIFKPIPGQDKPIRTVLTKGVAGIGKTVSVQKFILDWAEGKANQDLQFVFSLPFRELNLMKEEKLSLIQLINHFTIETKKARISNYTNYKVLFIFDGLDECRLPLDFKNTKTCSDVTESTTVDMLLTNLIRGNLLPSALLWITTRPAAANQIPSLCVDQVTEVRGFNDPQKEEYFRKRFSDEDLASRIISHIKTSRSLHIMCHIPVFCWISATVLETMLKEADKDEIPRTLTQMYEHFLLIQICLKNKKYNNETKTNPRTISQSDREMILKLSKLAFLQLQKGNLIFYEEDLSECDIDVTEASEYSALCTEIFIEESGLYQEKVFSFVHLSFQEFLAAVHALEFSLDKEELVQFDLYSDDDVSDKSDVLFNLYRRAVDGALKSENGHLDLFLRFLLGLSLESNQNLLRGILTLTGKTSESNMNTVERTVKYLSECIENESSPERIINLFHCLNELGSNSLVEDIQTSLRSGTLSEKELEPDQCSALAYLLLMSEGVLEEFNMKTYNTSHDGYQRLLPVVKTCKRALLDGCNLMDRSCETLALCLQTPNCPLRELDLSSNLLYDKGMKLLCSGPTSWLFNMQTLVLSGCGITEEGCASLVSALKSNPSHLKELDLSYNDLKDTGVKQLTDLVKDPQCKLETLRSKPPSLVKTKPCQTFQHIWKETHDNLLTGPP